VYLGDTMPSKLKSPPANAAPLNFTTTERLAESQRKNAALMLEQEFPQVAEVKIRIERIGLLGLHSPGEEYIFRPRAKAHFRVECLCGCENGGFELNVEVRQLISSGKLGVSVRVPCSGISPQKKGGWAPCHSALEGHVTVVYC
jgi:hypothetical protein